MRSIYMPLDIHPKYMSHCIYMHFDMQSATASRPERTFHMNTENENPQNQDPNPGPADQTGADEAGTGGAGDPGERRPLGYWLRAVDALLTREFAAAFESEGVTRRDWMLLNVLSGDVDAPGVAERLARKGKRLRRLEELGWAEEQGDGTWALTDDGRAARERLGAVVDGIRARVAGAVSPED